jgi:hypothetical protein
MAIELICGGVAFRMAALLQWAAIKTMLYGSPIGTRACFDIKGLAWDHCVKFGGDACYRAPASARDWLLMSLGLAMGEPCWTSGLVQPGDSLSAELILKQAP